MMLGGKATSLPKDGWYVIARDGNLVLRIRPGMQLGEDSAGELRFDAPDSELTFDIREDGRLVLVAGDGHELEVEPGERIHSVDLGYESHVRIRLPNNELSLATELVGTPPAEDCVGISTVRTAGEENPAPGVVPTLEDDEPPGQDAEGDPTASDTSGRLDAPEESLTAPNDPAAQPESDITLVAPPPLFGTGLPAALAARAGDDHLILVPEPRPAAATAGVPDEPAPDDTLERAGAAERDDRGSIRFAAAWPYRRSPLITGIALGAAALLAVGYLSFRPPTGGIVAQPGADPGVASAARPGQVDATSPASRSARDNPSATGVSAEASERNSTPAAIAAENTGRRSNPADAGATTPTDLPAADLPNGPPRQAADGAGDRREPAAPAIAEAGPATDTGNAAPGRPIERVYVPPILRKTLPEPSPETRAGSAGTPFASLESPAPGTPTAPAEPTATDGAALVAEPATGEPGAPAETSTLGATLEQGEQAATAMAVTNERDLRAAADALERGLLMAPPAASAFALYSRVLESDPDSPLAHSGLQLVRERLLVRARAALAAERIDRAMSALDDARAAGADPGIVAMLRAQASYRQRLRDAKAGVGGTLYPISELTALSQDLPEYPRHAPAGAEGSVDIEMTVTENGGVRDLEVLGDPPMYFIRAARQAVAEWRFAPVLLDGRPVPVRTSVKVTFRRED